VAFSGGFPLPQYRPDFLLGDLHFLFICYANPLEAYSFVIVSGWTPAGVFCCHFRTDFDCVIPGRHCFKLLGASTDFYSVFFHLVLAVRNLHFVKWREIARLEACE